MERTERRGRRLAEEERKMGRWRDQRNGDDSVERKEVRRGEIKVER